MNTIPTTPTTWEFMTMPLKKFTDFSGRARRSEYWWFQVFQWLIGIVFGVIAAAFNLVNMHSLGEIVTGLSGLVSLALIIPSLAVTVRRLHDVGRSGWWFLIIFTIIGIIVLIVWHFTDSDPGSNKWGPNPKNPVDEEIDTIDHLITDD